MRVAREKPKCKVCGNRVSRHTGEGSTYCSSKCYGLDSRKPRPSRRVQYENICAQCKKVFLAGGRFQKHKHAKFCSKECAYLHKAKEIDNYFEINDSGGHRRSAIWEKLRRKILARDENKCKSCHNTNCILLVHHIVPRRKGGEHTEKNLISLCNRCHLAIECLTEVGYYNDKEYKPKDLLELLKL